MRPVYGWNGSEVCIDRHARFRGASMVPVGIISRRIRGTWPRGHNNNNATYSNQCVSNIVFSPRSSPCIGVVPRISNSLARGKIPRQPRWNSFLKTKKRQKQTKNSLRRGASGPRSLRSNELSVHFRLLYGHSIPSDLDYSLWIT